MRFQNNIDITVCVLLLGLFPALYLPVLQAMLLIMIVVISLSFSQTDRSTFRGILTFPNLAIAQFLQFFLLNAIIFSVVEENKPHFRAIAIESWSVTFLCLVILALWLQSKNAENIKQALIRWLPLGLTGAFLISTAVYFFGNQGTRIEVFTPGPLTPPFWFLVLSMTSFTWFSEMGLWHKIWRVTLFFMAGIMVVYGGARLVMLAWVLCSVALAIWIFVQTAPEKRLHVLLITCLSIGICAGGVMLVDAFRGGLLVSRMMFFSKVDFTYGNIGTQILRVQMWAGALSIIVDNALVGVGQVNERIALRQELEWDRWLRAHQTYLSYLIAGGIPALISGLILQSPVLAFLSRARRSTFFPAFLGLGVVVTMNCLTDSIFQSGVNVQVFMVATLIFLRASEADQPTLAPQKQVSSAAA